MARPFRNLDGFNDVVVRDVSHRHQFQTAPSANIIQHLYSHVSGSTANVSAAEVVSIDGANQGQWDLLLSTSARRLDANVITTTNTASWSSNSMVTVRSTNTTIRSANVIVGNLTATSVSATSAVIGNTTSRSFIKTLGAAQNSFSLICDMSGPDCYAFELAVVQQTPGVSIAKSYYGTVQFSTTGFKRLIPLSSTGNTNSRDWAVDISVSGATSQFRLVRRDTGNDPSTVGGFVCTLKIHSPSSAVIIADNTTTGTAAVNTGPFESTLVAQVDGMVGIGTDSPAWPLDVVGTINTSGVYQIGETQVLSGTTLGSGVLSSSLTSVGTLTSLTATSVSATSAVIGNTTSRSFIKTLDIPLNAQSNVCTLSSAGAYAFELAVAQNVTGSAIAKSYYGTVQFSTTGFKRLIPLSSTGPSSARDWAVDISVSGSTSIFRLVRTANVTMTATQTLSLACTLKIHNPSSAVVIVDNTTTGTDAVNTGFYEGTLVTQVNGMVGIGTDSPTFSLDVSGNTNLSIGNTYHIAGTPVLSGSTLGSGVLSSSLTSVGTLTSLVVNNLSSASSSLLGETTLMETCKIFSVRKTLPPIGGSVTASLVGDAMSLSDINSNFGSSCVIKLDIAQCEGQNNSISKAYTIPIGFNTTQNQWRRVLPDKTDSVVNDIGVEIRVFGNVQTNACSSSLRLVRTRIHTLSNLVNSNVHCNFAVHYSKDNPVTISGLSQNTPSYSTMSNEFLNPADVYCGTYLTQRSIRDAGGNPTSTVGIGTEFPDSSYLLDCNGSVKTKTLYCTANITADGMVTANTLTGRMVTVAQPNITSVGTLSSLTVSGTSVLNGPIGGSGVTSSVADGSTALVTSGGVYSALSLGTTLGAFQTLSVGQTGNPGTFRVVGDASLDTSTGAFRGVVSASDQLWSSVCYGNGEYVAVSEGATNPGVMTSMDGRIWVTGVGAPSTGAAWKSVAFGNNLYVAIAANGSIMRSANGSTWTAVRTDTLRQMTSIAFGNNVFVAVSLDNNVLVGDATATTWVLNTGITNQAWQSIAFGATQFVAVASSGVNIRVATSSNGTAWTSRFSAADLLWKTVSYGDGVFVALADSGTGRIMTSADGGLTWSLRTNPVALAWTGVAYGAGRWLAVASDGVGTRAMTSVDGGVTWTIRAASADLTWRAIVYGASEFAAVASSGTANRAMVWGADEVTKALAVDGSASQLTIAAPNVRVVAGSTVVQGNVTVQRVASTSIAMTWTTRTGPSTNQWQSVAYGVDHNLFVAVSSTGNVNRVMTSKDGYQWTSRQSAADNSWNCVAYGNLTFVAVSSTGLTQRVMTSANGVTWTSRSTPAAGDTLSWQSVVYGSGRFVAVASTATAPNIMTSDDNGATWTIRTGPSATAWTDIAYGNGIFVVFSSSALITSPDGITWTPRTSPTTLTRDVTFGGGLFVVLQSTGTRLFTSPDGVTWTGYTIALNTWESVTYGDGLFVAVASTGTNNRVVTSNDGITWTARDASAALLWKCVIYGKGVFVAVANDTTAGLYDRIMTSTGVSDTITTSPLLVVDTVTGNVGIRTASPAFALDVAGTVNSQGPIRGGSVSVLSNVSNATSLQQGAHFAWNSFPGGTGEATMINKHGSGGGGFTFFNSAGNNSDLSNKAEIGSITSGGLRLGGIFPIQFARFSVEGGSTVDTGFLMADWHPSVAQFAYQDGDIQETGAGDVIQARFVDNGINGSWAFTGMFRTHLNGVTIFVTCMFINKTLTGQAPTFNFQIPF